MNFNTKGWFMYLKNAPGIFWGILIFIQGNCIGQQIQKQFTPNDSVLLKVTETKRNIIVPDSIKTQALLAYSFYPKLRNTKIEIRISKSKTPLTSRPTFFSIFKKAENRSYIIRISKKSNGSLQAILYPNLPFNAQVGVLGHELGHIASYNCMNGLTIFVLPFRMFSRKFTDHFEYATDLRCIQHGLGYQLLAWSSFVRKALITGNKSKNNRFSENSKRERYMRPDTILKFLRETEIYNKTY